VGAVQKLDRPVHFPGCTVWGRTQGPVVYLGEVIKGNDKLQGVSVFLDERESREVLIAWGWPLPEKYREAELKMAELETQVAQLEAELAVARPLVTAVQNLKEN